MTPTLTTVTRDFLALSDEEQSRFRDVIDILSGAITLEDVEEVADLTVPKGWRDVPVAPDALKPPTTIAITGKVTAKAMQEALDSAVKTLPKEPPRPKGRRLERYNAPPKMLKLLLESIPKTGWITRANATAAMGKSKATMFRAECTALRQGLIEAKTVKGQRLLRLAPSQPATEGTPE